jgi:hypothetical protein
LYGFSPVCVRLCTTKWLEREQRYEHWSHSNGLGRLFFNDDKDEVDDVIIICDCIC